MLTKNRLILLLFAVCHQSQGMDFQELVEKSKVASIQAIYERETLPSPKSREKIDQQMASIAAGLSAGRKGVDGELNPAQSEAMDRLLKKSRESLENGSKQKYDVTLQQSAGGILASFDSSGFPNNGDAKGITWNYLGKDRLVEYDDRVRTVIISDGKSPQRSVLGVMLFDLGVWGNMELLDRKGLVLNDDGLSGSIKYPAGEGRFRFSSGEERIDSQVVELDSLGGRQKEERVFNDFRPHGGGLVVPYKTENSFESPEVRSKNRIEITSVRIADDANKIAAPSFPQFGLVTVTDIRKAPPVSFRAYNVLPSDEMIASFTDPAKLTAHDEKVMKLAREDEK